MARLKIYTVHIDPSRKNPYENPIFVAEGFNIHAFLFGWAWAFYQKLWLIAVVLLAMSVIMPVLKVGGMLHPLSLAAIQLGIEVFFGFEANDLRRAMLKKQGYIVADVITSDNLIRAEQRFFDRYFPVKVAQI